MRLRTAAAAVLTTGLLWAAPGTALAAERVDPERIERAAEDLVRQAGPDLEAGEIHVDPFFQGAISSGDRELIARAGDRVDGTVSLVVLPPYAPATLDDGDVDVDLTAEVVDRAGRELLGDDAEVGDMVVFLLARAGVSARVSVQTPSGVRTEIVAGSLDGVAWSAGPIGHRAIRVADGLARGEQAPPISAEEASADRIDPRTAGLLEESSFTWRSAQLGAAITGVLVGTIAVVQVLAWRRRARDPRLSPQRLAEYEAAARASQRALGTGDESVHRAAARLPDPLGASPLLQAAWVVLEREARGELSDFFDPLRPAVTRRWSDLLGAQVPVSAESAEALDSSRLPPTLRDARGRPHWRGADSPLTRSGYGAFAPLAETLLADKDAGPLPAGARGRRTVGLAVAVGPAMLGALVIGIVAGSLVSLRLSEQDVADYIRTTPAELRVDLPKAFSEEAREIVGASVAERNHFIHPSLFAVFDDEELDRLDAILDSSSRDLAFVAIPQVGSDQPYHLDAVQALVPDRPVLELSGYGRLSLQLAPGVRNDDLESQFAVEEESADLDPVEGVERWSTYLDRAPLSGSSDSRAPEIRVREPEAVSATAGKSVLGAAIGSFLSLTVGVVALGLVKRRRLPTPSKRPEGTRP